MSASAIHKANLFALAATLVLAINTGTLGAAYCPSSVNIVTWEPFSWAFNRATFLNVKQRTVTESQGYKVLHEYTQNAPNGLPDVNLTPNAFLALAQNAGILIVDTHGDVGKLYIMVDDPVLNPNGWVPGANCINWAANLAIASGLLYQQGGGGDINVERFVNEGQNNQCYSTVTITAQGLQKLFANTLNQNNAIVVIAACHGAEAPGGNGITVQAGSVADLVGGRLVLAYYGTTTDRLCGFDLSKFFGRMNGGLPADVQGSERLASSAYAVPDTPNHSPDNKVKPLDGPYTYEQVVTAPTYDREGTGNPPNDFDNEGNGYSGWIAFVTKNAPDDTTLCPAVAVNVTLGGGVSHNEPTAATAKVSPAWSQQNVPSSGNGFVQFDTRCDNTVAASQIVSSAFGLCKLSNVQWDNALNDSQIDFTYKLCPGWISSWLEAVKVSSGKLTGNGKVLNLDGNTNPAAQWSGGVAPNGDDFYWLFASSNGN